MLTEFTRESKKAKQLGFTGRLVIHPNQIDIVNRIFGASDTDLLQSKQNVEAYQKALSNGVGVIQVNGQMVDLPVFERAKRLLKLLAEE
ncbi:hypothetical protein NZD89_12275 [Alicyclobacillus fastidiosus]|uniref:HpcH/HpaI aldolase/citrate lyase domain-containing protein n=1 Tax=Alicyclobacillus fastidiosus TaxID=392011 RepID=A0ABY6ZMC7_9BACL|nr:hypothetical protein [Alicyclobacillus fastidiosus]WAH44083.1 hypothetical protein NZD89_12275 [Alicyclobacillus fastidiosus]